MRAAWILLRSTATAWGETLGLVRWRHRLLARRVTILPGARVTARHRVTFGEDVLVSHEAFIQGAGGVTFGSRIMLGPRVTILTVGHEAESRRSFARPVEIADGVWIGAGAMVLPGVRIGADAIVAAGAVVTRDVPPGVLVAGVPGRVVKELPPAGPGYFEEPSWRRQFGLR